MLVYVSGKYSGDSHEEISDNILKARKVAIELWEQGHAVICPHLNTSHMEVDCHIHYDNYIEGDLMMIARCDAMVMLSGWEDSQGAVIEKGYAENLRIPIYYEDSIPSLHVTEVRCPEQAKAFAEILGVMYRTHLDKNADYSPANILGTGDVGLITRLWDKIARILNLSGFQFEIKPESVRFVSPKEPKNESLDDSFMDAAVYTIIGILLRQGKWGR